MASTELEQKAETGLANVDPQDEPSAAWGWHGHFPKGRQIAGWAVAIILLAMIYGPHESHVENAVLIFTSLCIMGGLLWDLRRRRPSWRR